MLPNLAVILILMQNGITLDWRTVITNACLWLWGLRLSLHVGCRHKGEDYRYVEMREEASKYGKFCYYFFAYLYIFMMLCLFSLIVNAPVLYVNAHSSRLQGDSSTYPLIWSDYLGLLIFVIGLLFEWVGDEQLKAHIADTNPHKGKFCKRGLWRYTRHPNYFGDALLWWGFYFIAFALPKGYWTFFGPLVMTILLRYVSGVALLE